jgi:hypothetical protein
VWAPVTVATLFVLGGSYLFWTADHERRYRWTDVGVLLAAAGLTVAAFLVGSNAVIDHRVPEHFPLWLFWSGVAVGTAWFVGVERTMLRKRKPCVGVRVRTILPPHTEAMTAGSRSAILEGTTGEQHEAGEIGGVIEEYREATNRLDSLAKEASVLAERFERIAHGLSARPGRVIAGLPDERVENPREWDIGPSHPLPSIEHLTSLTNDIRAVGATVEELRERLILMGHVDLVEQPDEFFH